MGLFDRMSRLVSSNVNALLDRAEDPRKSVELMLEEMKEQITLAQRELVSSFATEKQLAKKVEELDADAERWARRAELALKADDENLAREALVQKRKVIAERDRTEALLTEARATTLRMKSDIERMEEKAKELEARKASIAARMQQARADTGTGSGSAFDEFRRIENQLEHAEATAAASEEVEAVIQNSGGRRMSDAELEAKFASLEGGGGKKGGSEVDDELAALKRKMRVGS
ncbi:MAG: PspA/IM30 family protein [Polyangiaceae bacterium]